MFSTIILKSFDVGLWPQLTGVKKTINHKLTGIPESFSDNYFNNWC